VNSGGEAVNCLQVRKSGETEEEKRYCLGLQESSCTRCHSSSCARGCGGCGLGEGTVLISREMLVEKHSNSRDPTDST